MERLTERDKDGWVMSSADSQKIREKLADYEDAEEQGRLMVLPVAKGSTVYYVPDYLYGRDSRIEELYVMGYRIFEDGATYLRVKQTRFSGTLVNIKRIGEDVFLTREEAEAKREKMEDRDGQKRD